ncbi:hypothetical protein [Poritiphilus flavus]|uniref:Class I SAM-dependent methyltransferase n=1 Tax=Poritiphilus flavus TaxID=2697053 RepID=A0A6L9EE97_9FLAO|nr:hypothetical protein [Poritiphilus flavus]NAS12659.1 hypothetical protein [Poritiphilus flavus]
MKGLKRIQLFEFEDFEWFPGWLRSCMTRLIVILQSMIRTDQAIAVLIARVYKEKGIMPIVDLGSGAGGMMPDVLGLLKKQGYDSATLLMTDLYPNEQAIAKFNGKEDPSVRYSEQSVDATNMRQSPEGLKTMMNSFHHMRPEQAKKILASAKDARTPLLIYEMGENKMPLFIWWLFLPLSLLILMIMVLFMTPFVKPMTWQQLIFTYLIPIIPICYAWDGQASMPRMYALKDIDILLEDLHGNDYKWEHGAALKPDGKKQGTYILGLPVN